MKYIERDLGDIDHCHIIPLSDIHVGDKHFNEKKYLKMIDWIAKTDNVFVTLGGDLINNAIVGSVSDIYGEVKTPTQAKRWVVKSLEPIQSKLIAMVTGNHENRSRKLTDWDISEDIASDLKVPYAPESIVINYKIDRYQTKGKINYTMYLTHGSGGGGTPGGRANAIAKAAKVVMADIYVMGHVHNEMAFPDTIFVPDVSRHKLIQSKRLYVIGGGYLEYGGYAESAMMSPSKTGAPRIYLDGKRKDFHVSI